MGARWIGAVGIGVVVALAGCGGDKKRAKDGSDEKPSYTDETPKWEGAGPPPPKLEQQEKSSSSSSGSGPSAGGGTSGTSGQGSSGGAVKEATPRRTDQYDKEGTEIALKRAARQVKANCGATKDDNGKAIGPWGKVTIQVQLGHNGHSRGTSVPPPYQGKPVGNCIEKAFQNLTFPPWNGQDTQVDWEVELIEPGKEAKK